VCPALGCVHDDRIRVLCLWLACTVRLVGLVAVAIVVVVYTNICLVVFKTCASYLRYSDRQAELELESHGIMPI